MKKYLLFILAIGVILVGSSCASKRYAKQGLKYEQAGMYEMAAQSYYQSLMSKKENIDARIGLKKNGQMLLDKKVLTVQQAYDASDDKKTVYSYLDAKGYQDQVAALGIDLMMSDQTTEMFKEAKARYIEKTFNDAQLLLEDEKFSQADELLAEIKKLEPGYSNSDELIKVSKCEPIYRQGKEFLNTSMYRKSYASFDQIVKNYGSYKDAKDLRDEALSKGMITISISKIENKTSYEKLQDQIDSKIRTSLNNLRNPFIKIIDSQNTNQLIQEQQRGLNQGSEIQVGKILAAKALFTGSIIAFEVNEGKFKKDERHGYLKEEITIKDPTTGMIKKNYKYSKVTYFVCKQANSVNSSFQYQLTSTESSAVIVSDAMDISANDEVNYAVFQGNNAQLVPGYWERIDKDSPKDRVDDSPASVEKLQELLKSKKNIKNIETLKVQVLNAIADRVAKKISVYNPEE